jgi:uncharacterized membrane protein YqjE
MHDGDTNGRTLTEIVEAMKDELKQFLQTRLLIFRTEAQETLKSLRNAALTAALGALLLGTAYLLFTMALIALLVPVFQGNPYRWFFAFVIVAGLWTVLGATAAYLAKREFQVKGMVPKKTIGVLKDDKIWIESEVKN